MQTEQHLRVAVADDEPDILLFFRELLPHLGHEVVAEAETGKQLVERCRAAHPGVVITDVKMPDMDGLQAAAEVNREERVPVILITGHHDADVLARAGADYIMAYLAKPVKPVELQAALHLAMLRFAHFETLVQETADLRQALTDRKLIERAKGAVMRRVGVDEEEAFRRLRKLSSDHNRKLAETAQLVMNAEEVFHRLERG